jgi:hypothetical protein
VRIRGTESFRFFAEERNRLLGLNSLLFAKILSDVKDDLAQITGNAPPELQRPLPSMEELDEYKGKQIRFTDYAQLALELTYCRVADSFERYRDALLKEILTLHPAIRRGSPGRKGLPVSHEVESEVGSLRGSVREIAGEIGKRYKILIFTDEADTIEIERILETRHVLTHAHGILDHRALKRLGLPAAKIGVRISVTSEEVGRALGVVSRSVETLDERAASRFNLPTVAAPALRTKA